MTPGGDFACGPRILPFSIMAAARTPSQAIGADGSISRGKPLVGYLDD